jgi:hypothetical protein
MGAFVMDVYRDLAGHEPGHQAPRTDLPGQEDLLPCVATGFRGRDGRVL